MQNIKSKSRFKQKLLIVVAVVAFLISIATAYAYVKRVGPFTEEIVRKDSSIDYSPPSDEQVEAGNRTKDGVTKTDSIKPGSSQSSSSVPTSSAAESTVGIDITNEPKNNNGSLSVKTLVQEVNSTGTCKLTLSKSGQPSVVKSAKTQVSGSVATCQGFSIDVTNLSKGVWNIRVDYKSDKSVGTTSESVTL